MWQRFHEPIGNWTGSGQARRNHAGAREPVSQ
jgi:hypothetical protein